MTDNIPHLTPEHLGALARLVMRPMDRLPLTSPEARVYLLRHGLMEPVAPHGIIGLYRLTPRGLLAYNRRPLTRD